jgi:3-hydroxyisobutyrate dehydrogenase-like beta-hydroxyacid dehydrogenase
MSDTHGQGDDRVAVLGTGIMGAAMARRLLAAGLPVTVWDRSAEVTAPLAAAGAHAAPSAAEAVRDARVAITMLPTAAVVESVVFDGRVAQSFAPDAVWAQMGTIGIGATGRLAGRLAGFRPDVLGVDVTSLDEAIEGGPLDAPIADAKLHKMQRGDYAPEFPLEWALKDVDLAIEAAAGCSLPLLAALSRQWHAAVDAGHGREDVSAARLALGQ